MEYTSDVFVAPQGDAQFGTVPAKSSTGPIVDDPINADIGTKVQRTFALGDKPSLFGVVPPRAAPSVIVTTGSMETTTIFPVDKSPKQHWY